MTAVTRRSYALVFAAFSTWGLLPIYWKLLSSTAPSTLLFCRAAASTLVLFAMLRYRGEIFQIIKDNIDSKTLLYLLLSSSLLGFNWFSYLWAVNNSHMLSASLAYFISPILTVALGALFFGESITRAQKYAIAMLVLGVFLRSMFFGSVPWLALTIGASFSAYVMVRKLSNIDPQVGLFFELAAMTVPAAAFGLHQDPQMFFGLGQLSVLNQSLLALSGIVTVFPLFWFIRGAQKLSLSMIGVLQYLAPSLMLLTAVVFYDEPLQLADLWSFPLIWSGIILFLWSQGRSEPQSLKSAKIKS